MGYLNSEKPPEKWSPAFFKMFVERLRTAVNHLDVNNFPRGLEGSIINQSTMPFDRIGNPYFLSKIRTLNGLEMQYVFFATAVPFTVNTTSLTKVGSFVLFDNIIFTHERITLCLEATLASYDNTATATLELHGVDGKLAEVTTNTGQLEWKRSDTFTPPTDSQTLLVKAKTSNGDKPANLLSAKLIVKIN